MKKYVHNAFTLVLYFFFVCNRLFSYKPTKKNYGSNEKWINQLILILKNPNVSVSNFLLPSNSTQSCLSITHCHYFKWWEFTKISNLKDSFSLKYVSSGKYIHLVYFKVWPFLFVYNRNSQSVTEMEGLLVFLTH